jgi:hypothetical protein
MIDTNPQTAPAPPRSSGTCEQAGEPSPASPRARRAFAAVLVLGTALRLSLVVANPPENTWDNFFRPVSLAVEQGRIPEKTACYECYHPPLFFAASALVARAGIAADLDRDGVYKLLQVFHALFGLAAFYLVWPILGSLSLGTWPRLIAFLLVAVIPRGVYSPAMYANEVPAQLFVALACFLALRFLEGRRSLAVAAAAGGAAAAAVFTKISALALVPALAVVPAVLHRRGLRPAAARAAAIVLIPAVLAGASMWSDWRRYGAPIPNNTGIFAPATVQPRDPDGGARLLAFEPWKFVAHPMLAPGQLGGFWTLMNAGAWFDVMPKFLPYSGDPARWLPYYAWLRGEAPYPGSPVRGVRLVVGQVLEALGLVALALLATGTARALLRPSAPVAVLAILLAGNVAGMAYYAVITPVFSAMKTSYLLMSTPAFAALAALGAETWWRRGAWRWVLISLCAALTLVVVFHVGSLAWTMSPQGVAEP